MIQCDNPYPDVPDHLCQGTPVTVRKTWRPGSQAEGDELVVERLVPLCEPCAKLWDEAEAENEAEARMS